MGSLFDSLYEEAQRCIAPNGKWESRKWKAHKDLRKRIEEADLSPHKTLGEKLYAIRHNVRTRPVCAVCGGEVKLKCQITGYRRTCSLKCAANDPATHQKTTATLEERYGGHFTRNPEWIRKFVKRMHDVGAYKKGMETFEKRYGVKNRYQLESVKKTIKDTNLERYGVENPQQNLAIRAATKATTLERYGAFYNPVKTKQTNLERYGVENASQNKEVRAKVVKTNLKRYGVKSPASCESIFQKMLSSAATTKKFTLPSGKVIHLQGYEPQVLTYMFENGWQEDDFAFPIPRITYGNGNIYTPDLWIPNNNLLIEVKSAYTWFHKNHAVLAQRKAQAAKDAGYNIEVWIWDNKAKTPQVITI